MATIFYRSTCPHNVLKVIWSSQRLVHSKVIFVVVVQPTTLILARLRSCRNVVRGDMSCLLLRLSVCLRSCFLRILLLPFVFCLFLVVGELDIVCFLIVQIRGIRKFLRLERLR
jgi:hypothetical protein